MKPAPENRKLVLAIQAVLDAPEEELGKHLAPLLHTLLASTLIITEDRDRALIETDDDEALLAVFTDPVELFQFDNGAAWTTISAEDAIRLVAGDDYDGLIINCSGNAFELSKDDVTDMFDID